MSGERQTIGRVVKGSLSGGLEIRLNEEQAIEALRAGQFVVVEGRENEFFGMITDLQLAALSDDPLYAPPPRAGSPLERVLRGTSLFETATVRPSLMTARSAVRGAGLLPVQPAKTVPAHFSPAFTASAADVAGIFGGELPGDYRYFAMGTPLEMGDIPLCLDVDALVARSTGIFGKSGTGKTFLTRLALCSIMRNSSPTAPVALVFDMHNEYADWCRAEGPEGSRQVVGLRQIFYDGRVEVGAVSRRGAGNSDFDVQIPYNQIEPEDILLLHRELNLHRTAAESAFLAEQAYRERWFERLLEGSGEELAEETKAHAQSLSALTRKIRVLQQQCRTFLKPQVPEGEDAVIRIMRNLQQGRHTIIEFGACRSPAQYMLVANILSRRIHDRYVELAETHEAGRGEAPRPLVIAIEEAHKFLSTELADQTIFSTIAREMRKYLVTLLVVDQRPSGIDPEIVSQLGTKICCLLDNDRDVDAVLSGVSGGAGLRGVLASLSTRQQAMILGHAVPMPVVIDTREYGDAGFMKAMQVLDVEEREALARSQVESVCS